MTPKAPTAPQLLEKIGGRRRARTSDPLIKSPMSQHLKDRLHQQWRMPGSPVWPTRSKASRAQPPSRLRCQSLLPPALPQFSANSNHRHEQRQAPPGHRIGPVRSPAFAENRPQPHESGTQNGTQTQDTPRRRWRRIANNHMKSLEKTWSGRWDSNPRPQPWQVWAARLWGFAKVHETKPLQWFRVGAVRHGSRQIGGNHSNLAPYLAPRSRGGSVRGQPGSADHLSSGSTALSERP